MSQQPTVEGLLRDLAPLALAAVARRYGGFADCEDAVQETLIKAARTWHEDGVPDRPLGWMIRVASRELIGRHRSDSARHRRETLAASWTIVSPDPGTAYDDSLTMLFLCCHDALSPSLAIPLTLRAVGGLTTREIADAFLVKEATMAQRISRAKAAVRSRAEPFRQPDTATYSRRLPSVLHVLYLIFNEGHTASAGSELGRSDLAAEAIRLTRLIHEARPDEPEISGLLALMLVTDSRRSARTAPRGELVPLAQQDRRRWDQTMIREGTDLATSALRQHRPGPYQLQAAIAVVHAEARSHDDTDWARILALYNALDRRMDNPIVTVNRAVATAMAHGPQAGLDVLDLVAVTLADHHRYHAVRAHLLEDAKRLGEALDEYEQAIQRVTNVRERTYLQTRAATIRSNQSR